jgi:transposase InsO family protein
VTVENLTLALGIMSSSPRAVQEWIAVVGAKTAYIERGSPWENGYIESFNARLRDELLDGEILHSPRGPNRHRELAMALQALVRRNLTVD